MDTRAAVAEKVDQASPSYLFQIYFVSHSCSMIGTIPISKKGNDGAGRAT
jgi:hypothetical protein